MKLIELSQLANKKPQTVAMFFSRHGLSLRKSADVNFYLQQLKSGKRLERGLRSAAHLQQYRFQPQQDRLQKARELIRNRKLIWGVSAKAELSENKIIESALSQGDWSDIQEILRLLGKARVKQIFTQQRKAKRNNYRPQTLNFFSHYFALT